jgi:hypothetical protein
MTDMEVLHGFDPQKFNDHILRKEDEIKYERILISKSKVEEGIQHIRERHIDDVVRFFCEVLL